MYYITFSIHFDGSNLKIFQIFVNDRVCVCLICKLSTKKKKKKKTPLSIKFGL